MWWVILLVVVLLVLIVVGLLCLPDIRRYLRMRSM